VSPPAASRPPLLSCEGIAKQFGARPLFAGVSFGIAEGDRVGLIGPNGSGKTTLLRLLAGLEEPDEGTRALRKGARVGYVAQDPELDDRATAEEAVVASLADRRPAARAVRARRPRRPDARKARFRRSGAAGRDALRGLAQAARDRP